MRILVFQHLAVEHPGTFRDLWRQLGHQWHAVELDEGEPIPRLEDYDVLVVMGGPQDVWQEALYPWLAAEKAAIRRWVRELGRPYLGICLGHQLLAEALGGCVALMARPEVGLADVEITPAGQRDPLFSGCDRSMLTFQWHGAEITALPDDAVVLASNRACPVQAIRVGQHAYGLQYHVEITPTTASDWEAEPTYKASLEQAMGPVEAARLSETVRPHLDVFRGVARRINDNFMAALAERAVVKSA
jgi:GMP synthase-like glutamine amidotransferase